MNRDLRHASKLVLPAGDWPGLLDFLCHRFPHVGRQQWQQRFARQLVLSAAGEPLDAQQSCVAGLELYYFREVAAEPVVPFAEHILFEDELLLVVDKPHYLTVAPVGRFVEQTLLRRLQQRYPRAQLSPLHRLDRLTAGVIMLCKQPGRRDAYQQLFRQQQVARCYEAIAAPLPQLEFPYEHHSRLQRHPELFFLTAEVSGTANAGTRIRVLQKGRAYWHYQLQPSSGRKHQLRVHMNSLGAPIVWDDFYPVVQPRSDGFDRPLQLLARSIAFVDPVNGQQRSFVSARQLALAQHLDQSVDCAGADLA